MIGPNAVGVRELRQNLSVYLARVVAGETLEVTDRGRVVAVLAPLAGHETRLERLAREGRVIAPSADLLAGNRARRRTPRRLGRDLDRERADRRL